MIKVRDFRRIINELFLISFMLILLLCVGEESELSKRIVVFTVKGSKHILTAVILAMTFCLTCIQKMRLKTDRVVELLVIRFLLYLIPCLFVRDGSQLQIGLIAAVACSFMAYTVGKENECSDSFIALVLGGAACVISIQVLVTAFTRGLNINSPDLKWWMVIPIGQTNAIGTYFLPMMILLDGLKNTKNGFRRYILVLIEVVLMASILFMGSRSTLILMAVYLVIRYLMPKAKISKQMMTRLLIAVPVILVGAFLFLLKNNGIASQFASQFSIDSLTYTRFKVYQEALDVFGKHIFFGRGAYSYQVFDAVMAHNFVLEALIESGIIGSIPFFAAVIICIKQLKKIEKFQGTYLYAVIFMLIKALMEPTFYLASFEIFFWLLVGLGLREEKSKTNLKNKE